MNCYRSISVNGESEADLSPAQLAEEMRTRHLCLLLDESMILSEPDDTHMTVFDPDEKLLELIKALALSEGLFVWQPPQQACKN